MIEQEHTSADTPEEPAYLTPEEYLTWVVQSWLSVDAGLTQGAQAVLVAAGSPYEGAPDLQEWIEDQNPLYDAEVSLYTQILGWGLANVDWDVIAQTLWPSDGSANPDALKQNDN